MECAVTEPLEFQEAEERRPWNAREAVRATGELVPVEQYDTHDLSERECDDCEVVASQAQHRKAENNAPKRCEDAGKG